MRAGADVCNATHPAHCATHVNPCPDVAMAGVHGGQQEPPVVFFPPCREFRLEWRRQPLLGGRWAQGHRALAALQRGTLCALFFSSLPGRSRLRPRQNFAPLLLSDSKYMNLASSLGDVHGTARACVAPESRCRKQTLRGACMRRPRVTAPRQTRAAAPAHKSRSRHTVERARCWRGCGPKSAYSQICRGRRGRR